MVLFRSHAGSGHRQVSLLSCESVEEFNRRGAGVTDGAFGENLLVEGIDLKTLPVGSVLKAGTVVLRTTQIGKDCHSSCAIRRRTGDCIMPRERIFGTVLEEGDNRSGDGVCSRSREKASSLPPFCSCRQKNLNAGKSHRFGQLAALTMAFLVI